MESKTKLLTVSQVADRISEVIADYLPPVYVEGEVSNYYRSGTGHIYLSLKDDKALINAVVWNYQAEGINFKIENGMHVVVFGEVVTYKLRSQYQIKILSIRPSGLGNLYQAFEELKQKLEAEGLFDPSHKKPLIRYPSKIGVITSPTSAAVRDMIQVSGRRNPSVQLLIYPAVVQGAEAAATIISGLEYFNKETENPVDLIIIARGGGSIEDLWAFNEEPVVRAIFHSKIPVVTGIGHETDFTLSDFAADYRAPTPSAAAEETIPDRKKITADIMSLENKFVNSFMTLFNQTKMSIKYLERQINLLNPANTILNQIQHIDDLARRLDYLVHNKLKEMKNRIDITWSTLKNLNPESILERGFSIVYDENKKIIKSIKNINAKDKISIKLSDGTLGSIVESVTSQDGEKDD
ncbi:MAG: exodeoxyribonuclease VII large subunit [Candidatus Marinimicrobia bacterium]|nr:exodeoxyribonuclease VII large subunit [Candidatus Neomarinimicrobiota bacterium]